MISVTGLYIYPVKSLGGISMSEAFAAERGLRYDRRMMLVDDNGKFLTQREYPAMTHLHTAIHENQLVVTDARYEASTITIDLNMVDDKTEVSVWKDTLVATRMSARYDEFFSDYLGMRVSLVKMDDDSNRITPNDHGQVSFADGYPHLIVSEASLADLNERLSSPVEMRRFRPNIVLNGLDAYEEDFLQTLSIGDTRLKVTTPCPRCVLTTIDPTSGVKGSEPLATLSQYRREGNNVNFGANAITVDPGKLAVGDKVITNDS